MESSKIEEPITAMRKIKLVIGITVSIAVVSVILFFVLRYLVTKSFPEYSGTLSVASLREAVAINRDEFGVPHIRASNEYDLFFAQGYVHAQDRLWQMDLTRRAGEGRLSEILGPSTVKFDKMLKTVGFKRIAEQLERQLHPKSAEILIAYAAGVNEFIRTHKGRYPIEFDMLNYEPEEWTPVHSLMIARLMAWELNISWHVDVVLGELIAQLGEEKARNVFPTYPENAPVIVSGTFDQQRFQPLQSFAALHQEFKQFFGTTGTHIGSNSWAISPKKSASGKAMLANDPHLGLSLPAKWYENHLTGGAVNVAGVSLPGTPLVVLGHNPRVAWGFTNVMADDADFYFEQTDSLGGDTYLFKNEWKEIELIHDTVWVKDSAYVPFIIKKTHHGPAVNEVYPLDHFVSSDFITMKWTGFEMSDELYALYLVNTSRDWQSFLNGVKEFTVPGQNFVYADVDGNIGYHPGVRLPKRAGNNPTLPFRGWTGEDEWQGFIPFEELPSLFNPPDGFIASANNKTTNNAPYHIANLWEPPSRIQRIREVLQAKQLLDVSDFKKLQNDQYSHFAKEMTPFILSAYDATPADDPAVAMAVNYFRNWNFTLAKDDVPTTIFEVFFQHLNKNIYQDEMGENLYRQYIVLANIPYRVSLSLLNDTGSVWFDDSATPQIETREEIIRKSLKETVEELKGTLGNQMKEWRWGRIHTLTLKHPFGDIDVLKSIFNIGPFEVGGSGTTVNNGEYRFTAPYGMTLGPSMRKIIDFANINGALSVIPSGQSGQPLHDHYSDQTPLWKNGEYHTLPLDENEVLKISKNILYLTPIQ
ncbi:MAG: penicillin acylase family protein [Bacteriovoracaceae bacterium]|nr:penicillin acylase family protein [Bacteroidota bacterium]